MNKLFSLFLLLLIPFLGFSQIQSGEVIYRIKSPNEKDNSIADNIQPKSKGAAIAKEGLADLFERRDRALPHLRFKLEFTPNEAIFKVISGMDSDQDQDIISGRGNAIAFVGGSGVFYTHLNKDLNIHQHEYLEPILLERKISEKEWTLENEYQEIAGYTCQKAISHFYMNSYHPEVEIIAWFAKDLPFSFGPMGQAGLPGLILSLERSDFMYYAEKIKLSKKPIKINPPQKGKKITMDLIKDFGKNPEKYIDEF